MGSGGALDEVKLRLRQFARLDGSLPILSDVLSGSVIIWTRDQYCQRSNEWVGYESVR